METTAASRDRREEWRRYYANNWERLNARRKQWKKDNPEKNLEHKRRYAASNRDKEAARMRRWAKENPERALANVRNYKARKRNSSGVHSVADIERILIAQDGLCVYCSVEITSGNKHIDHMTPISRGGSNGPENLQVLCMGCNMRKHDKTHQEYILYIGGQP